VNTIVLAVGVALFAAISAMKFHFVSQTMPKGMLFISVLSAAGAFTFAALLWLYPQPTSPLVLALLLFALSGTLFLRTLLVTRSLKLKIAFDPDPPTTFTQNGPYKYIRHPLYAAYILFWLGCAAATMHPLSLAVLVILTLTYTSAALGEEHAFHNSEYAKAYAIYGESTGFFWPKLWSRASRRAHRSLGR
jgi:protein-S-isoprenylcysteine O-methyltransferase Ste14